MSDCDGLNSHTHLVFALAAADTQASGHPRTKLPPIPGKVQLPIEILQMEECKRVP